MLLLSNAQYGGSWESPGYLPLAYGEFTTIKAVYKGGYINCNMMAPQTDHPWQECTQYSDETEGFSFELKKNGDYVLESGSWGRLPPQCSTPRVPTGNIVCNEILTLQPGDTLTPTWYEPSHGISTSDNDGTITIDLYGFTEVFPNKRSITC